MNKITQISYNKHQHGVILVLALLLLSTLTLIAVTGMKTSIIGEKMSGNLRNSELAHQAAESALLEAGNFIDNLTSTAAGAGLTNTNGLQSYGTDEAGAIELDHLDSATWDAASPSNYTMGMPLGDTQLAQRPKYIIKHIGTQDFCSKGLWDPNSASNTDVCKREIFRITAFGTGLTTNTNKILQAYYERTAL